jgi:hypothetical protein
LYRVPKANVSLNRLLLTKDEQLLYLKCTITLTTRYNRAVARFHAESHSTNNMNSQDSKYDVKNILERKMPYLIKLLNGQNISWTKINRNLKKHNQLKKDSYNNGELVDINIFSIIVQFILENKNSFGMFHFYNSTFKQLFYRLTDKELKFTHKMIKYLLTLAGARLHPTLLRDCIASQKLTYH